MTITYRTPSLDDASALAAVGRDSFVGAFGHLYSQADLAAFLDASYSVATLRAELGNPRRVFRVVEQDGQMVGFCKIGLDMGFDIDLGARRGMELKQLYLLGSQTGGGTGSALIAWAIAEGRTRDYDDIILSVWSGNAAGQRFYRRHGFEKVGDTFFMVGNHKDDEYLFGLSLT
jgi:diamine N-acetyltransferase